MQIVNKTKNTIIANNVIVADRLFSRMKGLLGQKELKAGSALLLKPCDSIHTFFMQFPIDVLFVDKKNSIIKAISCLKPFRLSALYFNANFAVELPTGVISSTSTQRGDILQIT